MSIASDRMKGIAEMDGAPIDRMLGCYYMAELIGKEQVRRFVALDKPQGQLMARVERFAAELAPEFGLYCNIGD
jgi:hypothetical protein